MEIMHPIYWYPLYILCILGIVFLVLCVGFALVSMFSGGR